MNVYIAETLYIDLSFVASMIDLMAPTRCNVNDMVKDDLKMRRTEVHQPLHRSVNRQRRAADCVRVFLSQRYPAPSTTAFCILPNGSISALSLGLSVRTLSAMTKASWPSKASLYSPQPMIFGACGGFDTFGKTISSNDRDVMTDAFGESGRACDVMVEG